jgi:TolA-binding protein
MSTKILHFLRINLIVLIFVLVLSPVLGAANMQEKDARAYQLAYNLILEEKWEEATKALNEFVRSYSGSNYVDDARYWQCYAKEKLGKSLEDVFICYQDFIKAYSKSKWADDARSN